MRTQSRIAALLVSTAAAVGLALSGAAAAVAAPGTDGMGFDQVCQDGMGFDCVGGLGTDGMGFD